MHKEATITLALVFLSLGMIIATSGADVVSHHETDVLKIEDSSDGAYTQIKSDTGEIQIILTEENPNVDGEGVNGNAVTDIGPVITIENVLKQQQQATVWIDHDSEAVEFYRPGSGPVEGEAEAVTLQSGEAMAVALRVDTHERSKITLESIRVLATLASPAKPPDDTDDSDRSTDTPAETSTPTDGDGSKPAKTDTPTPTVTDTPNGTDSSIASPTATSTPADGVEEEAGFAPGLVAVLVALIVAVGGCAFLARRYGYV